MLIDDWFRRQGSRDRVQIEVYAAEPAPMGVAGPHVSGAVTQLLASKGIPYHGPFGSGSRRILAPRRRPRNHDRAGRLGRDGGGRRSEDGPTEEAIPVRSPHHSVRVPLGRLAPGARAIDPRRQSSEPGDG
jgi:hypothetical protein